LDDREPARQARVLLLPETKVLHREEAVYALESGVDVIRVGPAVRRGELMSDMLQLVVDLTMNSPAPEICSETTTS